MIVKDTQWLLDIKMSPTQISIVYSPLDFIVDIKSFKYSLFIGRFFGRATQLFSNKLIDFNLPLRSG